MSLCGPHNGYGAHGPYARSRAQELLTAGAVVAALRCNPLAWALHLVLAGRSSRVGTVQSQLWIRSPGVRNVRSGLRARKPRQLCSRRFAVVTAGALRPTLRSALCLRNSVATTPLCSSLGGLRAQKREHGHSTQELPELVVPLGSVVGALSGAGRPQGSRKGARRELARELADPGPKLDSDLCLRQPFGRGAPKI